MHGTGLGLPIVRKLAELMGGTIQVESDLGKGTRFTLTIPHRIYEAPAIPAATPVQEATAHHWTGKRILLAEDNALNAEIAITILEDMGLTVERAEDGVVCVDKMERAEPGYYDLILMDIQMPNMNGYRATEKIRRLPDARKASIPIFAMTANAFEEDKQKALDSGMNGHLAKPIDIAKLLSVLTEVLNTPN